MLRKVLCIMTLECEFFIFMVLLTPEATHCIVLHLSFHFHIVLQYSFVFSFVSCCCCFCCCEQFYCNLQKTCGSNSHKREWQRPLSVGQLCTETNPS
uniref:Uncharacterized protein n=1 Tax=Amblyomma triste TaxID=251400 RepID=A0A023G3W9_AMBTT